MAITIYHNPKCQTSRNVLGVLRDGGHEPKVIEYLKTPPSRAELKRLVKRMGGTMRSGALEGARCTRARIGPRQEFR